MDIYNTHRNALDIFVLGKHELHPLFLRRRNTTCTDTLLIHFFMSLHKAAIEFAIYSQQFLFIILCLLDVDRECVGKFDSDSGTVTHSFFVVYFLFLHQMFLL